MPHQQCTLRYELHKPWARILVLLHVFWYFFICLSAQQINIIVMNGWWHFVVIIVLMIVFVIWFVWHRCTVHIWKKRCSTSFQLIMALCSDFSCKVDPVTSWPLLCLVMLCVIWLSCCGFFCCQHDLGCYRNIQYWYTTVVASAQGSLYYS